MNAQDYIIKKLAETKAKPALDTPKNSAELIAALYAALTTKKFRKFSMSHELKQHIHTALTLNVENNEPINITFLHGAYKLWRLDESPFVDWAEFFALNRYINWLKPLCELYEPGVHLDFYVDDYIVPMLNNVEEETVDDYISSYRELINFFKNFAPENMNIMVHTVGEQFESKEAFKKSVYKNLEVLEKEQNGTAPTLSESARAMVELNVKVSDTQRNDPLWREKVYNLHNAYSISKAEPGYHKNQSKKILAFTSSLPMAIGVGTTRKAIMKFWVGSGVLERDDKDYDQNILSPSQLAVATFAWEATNIPGLESANFKKIRIVAH